MAIEYTCEECRMRVTAISVFQPPAHGFCVQCAFLCPANDAPAPRLS
jgi:hypothetical protein